MGVLLYHMKYGFRGAAVCLGCLLFSLTVHARTPLPSITIGRNWALVQEWRTLKLKRGKWELEIADIPGAADISSLNLRTKRRDLPLIAWEKLSGKR